MGAKVFRVKNMGSADPARNYGISKATYKWILSLDADERLPKTLLATIRQIINEDKFDIVKFPEKNIIFRKWIKHGMWWPDYHERLFKKGHLDYPNTIHTPPKYYGELLTLPKKVEYAIIHNHSQNIKEFLNMIDNYSSLDIHFKHNMINKKSSPSDIIEFINHEFKWRYLEHKSYLDGMHGFVISTFMNFYRFLEFAKYWEKAGYKNLFSQQQLLNSLKADPSLNELKK